MLSSFPFLSFPFFLSLRYFDANSALAISRNDEASESAEDGGTMASPAPVDCDMELEIDVEGAEDDEFLPFTANPR